MRRLTAVIASTVFFSSPLAAGNITSSAEALSIALRETGNAESETLRIQSIDSSLFKNGFVDWEFVLRDGATLYDVEVAADGSFKVETENDPEGAIPAFWAQLPLPNELGTIEDYVENAKSELTGSDATLKPRVQYIVSYEVCDPADPGDEPEAENGCDKDDPLEEWSVVLRADVEDTEEWRNRIVIFEDGQLAGISEVRIGGNW